MKTRLEIRTYPADVSIAGGRLFLKAPMFNERSGDLGGFTEIIRPGCFRNSFQRKQSFVWTRSNPDRTIADTEDRTLELDETPRGILATMRRSDETVEIEKADVATLAFVVARDAWGEVDGVKVREILEAVLIDIQPGLRHETQVSSYAQRRVAEWDTPLGIARRKQDRLQAELHRQARLDAWPNNLSLSEKRRLGVALSPEEEDRVLLQAMNEYWA